jgi:hypothetical protein
MVPVSGSRSVAITRISVDLAVHADPAVVIATNGKNLSDFAEFPTRALSLLSSEAARIALRGRAGLDSARFPAVRQTMAISRSRAAGNPRF